MACLDRSDLRVAEEDAEANLWHCVHCIVHRTADFPCNQKDSAAKRAHVSTSWDTFARKQTTGMIMRD